MKLFVLSGASGFIGRHLTSLLLSKGDQVIGLNRNRLRDFATNPASFESDLGLNYPGSKKIFICLSGLAHSDVRPSQDVFRHYLDINAHLPLSCYKSASFLGFNRYIYISSAKVYGEFSPMSTSFTAASPLNPSYLSPYAVSKAYAERLLFEASGSESVDLVSVRIPLVYGPGVKGNYLKLLRLVSEHSFLPFASLDCERSYAYVGSFAEYLYFLSSMPGSFSGRSVLFSDSQPLSTPSLVEILADAIGLNVKLFHCPDYILRIMLRLSSRHSVSVPSPLLTSFCLDPSADFASLGWRSPDQAYEGIRTTASWFKSTLSNL
jgi:nucleoside-diphosphate-sugar epimerase